MNRLVLDRSRHHHDATEALSWLLWRLLSRYAKEPLDHKGAIRVDACSRNRRLVPLKRCLFVTSQQILSAVADVQAQGLCPKMGAGKKEGKAMNGRQRGAGRQRGSTVQSSKCQRRLNRTLEGC
jgi:hypothetical protein